MSVEAVDGAEYDQIVQNGPRKVDNNWLLLYVYNN